ncbi:septation protein SepH [Promicromonospora iranensis]|uniref:septation protein SepH n=1 Tax=Promicromonospora iranensis TaxID=1105144 RepID=UPI0023A97BDB|nr:septation protein SepH [Promicromonospora iranensis]
MDELELVGLHEDGERLVLAARDGAQSTLPITDALRAAIRGDRPRMESIRAREESALRPREIQARLRAGETCEALAEASGLPLDHVRRFEYAVLSEREHSIARVRAKAVLTDDDGATTLGEVADERLRSRGVRPADARWTATREGTHPWIVQVEFEAAERPRLARWSLEPRGGFVTALDDEARWLGLPEDDGGPSFAGVSALPPHRSNHHPSAPAPPEQDDTDLLLDNLSERRGQRPARRQSPDNDLPDMMELDLDGADGPPAGEPEPAPEEAPEPSASVVDIGARRGGSRPRMPSVKVPDSPADLEWDGPSQWEITAPATGSEQRPDPGSAAEASPADNPAPQPAPQADTEKVPEKVPEKPPAEPATPKRPAAKRGRKSRAQVPSWDEIVFGSRPEV